MTTIYWTLSNTAQLQPDFLSPAEERKLASLRFEKRRQEWLLGRWTAKNLLVYADPACAAAGLKAITIENEPLGAPFVTLAGQDRYPGCLSISHREDMAFCAFSPDPCIQVGADLEWIEPRNEVYLEGYLTPGEFTRARSLPPAGRDLWISRVWSAKEALMKALRAGMRGDPRRIELAWDGSPGSGNWEEFILRTSIDGTRGLKTWWMVSGQALLTLAALPGDDANSPTTLDLRRITLDNL